MSTQSNPYPVTYSVDYPDRNLNRLTTFFRIFAIIPIAIILGLVAGGQTQGWHEGVWHYNYATGGLLVAPIVLMLLFRQKYPRCEQIRPAVLQFLGETRNRRQLRRQPERLPRLPGQGPQPPKATLLPVQF